MRKASQPVCSNLPTEPTSPKFPHLAQDFYFGESAVVARELLGKTLVHQLDSKTRLAARIVETEAYLGVTDKAAHSFGDRRTARTESMYLAGGHAYVFLIYGMHSCFNVVTGPEGTPEAVLIRAVQPLNGIETMMRNRKLKDFMLRPSAFYNLANGPGKLCQALNIDRSLDRVPLFKGQKIWIEDSPLASDETIYVSPRVGIDYAEEAIDWPLRFSLHHAEHRHKLVSKPRPLQKFSP